MVVKKEWGTEGHHDASTAAAGVGEKARVGEEIKFEALPILELCLSERISKYY